MRLGKNGMGGSSKGGEVLHMRLFPGDALLKFLRRGFFAKGKVLIAGENVEAHGLFWRENSNHLFTGI